MFEIGFSEIMVIALLALIVLGPEKLPKVAAQIGRWTGRARAMARNLRTQLEQEVSYEELLREKERAEAELRKATQLHPKEPTATEPAAQQAATSSEPTPNATPAVEAHAAPHDPHVASDSAVGSEAAKATEATNTNTSATP